jgi:hypothetical protein
MRLMHTIAAALRSAARLPLELEPADEAEQAAWESYRSSWEMDPAPDPRSVFLAGLRAGQSMREPEVR